MNGPAQNSQDQNVNDIWSVLNQPPVQKDQPDDQNQPIYNTPVPAAGKFGRPGTLGEGTGGWESGGTAEESLAKARKEEAQRLAEILKSAETLKPSEVQEKPSKPQVTDIAPTASEPTKGKIIDERSNKEKTHPVNPSADDITKKADKDEEEFIYEVEQVHSIAP